MRGRVLLGLALVGVLLVGSAGAAEPAWVWPVEGAREVVRPFTPPATRYGPGHRGADVAAGAGSVVRAAGAGRVTYAGPLAGRGVVVVVHGSLRTTYEPVEAVVRVGQQVAAGEVLGRLSGGHAGCARCLHWGLLRGEVYLDPVQLVRRGPSRLLPVPAPAAVPLGGPALRRTASAGLATPTPAAVPVTEPALALRSANTPWGYAALVALMLGLALLVRPSHRPPPKTPAPAADVRRDRAREPAADTPTVAVSPGVVDLTAERFRRRREAG